MIVIVGDQRRGELCGVHISHVHVCHHSRPHVLWLHITVVPRLHFLHIGVMMVMRSALLLTRVSLVDTVRSNRKQGWLVATLTSVESLH